MFRSVLLASALSLTALPSLGFDLENMTADERETFRSEIRNYLMENPEVLIEAIGVLEQKQAQQAVVQDQDLIAANMEAIFEDGNSWNGGNPDGDITIVEFVDYRCGYCRRAHPEVAELVETDGNIRIILKELPILGVGSTLSSQFAIAVKQIHGDETYKMVHDALITLNSDATPEALTAVADQMGLDAAEIVARMESDDVKVVIDSNMALAQAMNISGTPTFIMNNQLLRGYVPIDGMRARVNALREEG